MVDERFELLALIFRLAGREEYNDYYGGISIATEYTQKLNSTFESFKDHPAVTFVASSGYWGGTPFSWAIHLKEDGSGLISNTVSLGGNLNIVRQFLPLVKNFHETTDFRTFFEDNIPYYVSETEWFTQESYSKIDMEWFERFTDLSNLKLPTISPSTGVWSYSAQTEGKKVHCLIDLYFKNNRSTTIVHEYAHSWTTPLASEWYATNAQFRQWVDESIPFAYDPSYANAYQMRNEYVTRAYDILYFIEHGEQSYADRAINNEIGRGFIYLREVIDLVIEYEANKLL